MKCRDWASTRLLMRCATVGSGISWLAEAGVGAGKSGQVVMSGVKRWVVISGVTQWVVISGVRRLVVMSGVKHGGGNCRS